MLVMMREQARESLWIAAQSARLTLEPACCGPSGCQRNARTLILAICNGFFVVSEAMPILQE